MNILENGLVAGLVLVLYSIVDKVVVPLIKGRNENGSRTSGDRIQKVVNEQFERRLSAADGDRERLRENVYAIRADVQEAKAIVGRIESSLKDR